MEITIQYPDASYRHVSTPVQQWDKWVLSDFELLGSPFARGRSDLPGQPQTVNLACRENGLVPASSHYKRLTKELNLGMTDADLVGIMDKFTPAGAKWRDGDEKVPTEIIFASNPINVLSLIQNPGGLTGIPVGAFIYQINTLNYDMLYVYDTAVDIPEQYIMHFTVNLNGRDIVNPPPPGRDGLPVRLLITSRSMMYIRKELLDEIGSRNNRYSPPWDKGSF